MHILEFLQPSKAVGHPLLKGNMAPTKEVPNETMARIIKLLTEGNLQWNVGKDVGCSKSAL